MDAKHEVGQTRKGRYIIEGKILFNLIINIHVAVFLMHAFVSANIAQPDALKATLHSSPFLTLALSFICAKTIYPKFRDQKEKTLPLFRSFESEMKRRQLLLTPEAKERALTVLILTVLSLYFVYVTVQLPDKFRDMKVCFTIYWLNLGILYIVSEMYRSTTDIKWKRRIAAAHDVCLSIVVAQYCYCFVMLFILFDWAFPCLGFILGLSYLCYAVKYHVPHYQISSSCVLKDIPSDQISFWDAFSKPFSPYEIDFVLSYQMSS